MMLDREEKEKKVLFLNVWRTDDQARTLCVNDYAFAPAIILPFV